MKKLLLLLLIAILNITIVAADTAVISPDDISAGVFTDGNYYFPSTLYVGTSEDPDLGVEPALVIGRDTGSDYGIYYTGDDYAYPLFISSDHSDHTGSVTYGAYIDVDDGRAVYAETADTSSSGGAVYGKATGGAAGVYGYDSSGTGIGVKAYSTNKGFYTSGADYGLYIPDSDVYGVIAHSDGVGGRFLGDTYGVGGEGTYYGGYFEGDYIGVYARGDTDYGGYFDSDNIGVYARGDTDYGGYFESDDNTGVYAKGKTYGIYATGDTYGIWTPDALRAGSCTGCSDIAEYFFGEDLEPGDVVVLDTAMKSSVRKTTMPYNKLAAGIVSTNPTIIMGLDNGIPIALSGVVPTKVVGKVEIGDLLTTSSTSGYAMACDDYEKCQGAIIGKAMEANAIGKNKITALVMLG